MKLDPYTGKVSGGLGPEMVPRPEGWKSRPGLLAAAAGAVAMLALMLLLTAPILPVEDEPEPAQIDVRIPKGAGQVPRGQPRRNASLLDRMLAKMGLPPPSLSGPSDGGATRRESILARLSRKLNGPGAVGATRLAAEGEAGEAKDAKGKGGKKSVFVSRNDAGQSAGARLVSGADLGHASAFASLANAPKMPSFAESFDFASKAARVPLRQGGAVKLPQFARGRRRPATAFATPADAFFASLTVGAPDGGSPAGHLASPGKPSAPVEKPGAPAHAVSGQLGPLAAAGPSLGVRPGVVQGQLCNPAGDCNGEGERGVAYVCVNIKGNGFRWENTRQETGTVGCGGGFRHDARMTLAGPCGGGVFKCCPNPIDPLGLPGGWRPESEPCDPGSTATGTGTGTGTGPPSPTVRNCTPGQLFEEKTFADGTRLISAVCAKIGGKEPAVWLELDPPPNKGEPQRQPPCPTTNSVTCIEYYNNFGAAICKGNAFGNGPGLDWVFKKDYLDKNPGTPDPCQ